MLTKKQFTVLQILASAEKQLSQRKIAAQSQMSVGSVNRILDDFKTAGLYDGSSITAEGYQTLEPYRVKRAVILAAGFGDRMMPITLNTPKPLIRVNGVRIIDTMLDALYRKDIKDIYIVRGYLKEQFDQLLYKYPTIHFIDNDDYKETNNISSILKVKDILANCYVMEGDLIIKNPDLIQKYQYESNYLGVPVDRTDDWCFTVNNKKVITGVVVGGINCYHMYGISYWTEEDSRKLSQHIQEVYDAPGGKERFWDLVPLQYHSSDYSVHIRECTFDDIVEIDTFKELTMVDSAYLH